uniref:Bacterial sugar transferase domain-containing protein n=1 Tax=uncultured Bacillota bacterium TaxID=344338 RepID=A0A650ENB2_9FIRM|nr:hypothetical protein Firmicute1046_3450 [uncultured Firmicutes bacterium]
MSVHINRLSKQLRILLNIFVIFLIFLIIDRFIFRHRIDFITYSAGTLIACLTLGLLDSDNDLRSYAFQKKKQPLLIAVGLILSGAVCSVVLWIGVESSVTVGETWIILAVCYPILLILRNLLLRIFMKKRKSQTLLILYSEHIPNEFSEEALNNAVDYGTVQTIRVTEYSENEIAEIVKIAGSIIMMGDVSEDTADTVILNAKIQAIPIYIFPTIKNISCIGSTTAKISDTPLLSLKIDRIRFLHKAVKRLFDIFASIIGLIVLSPAFAVIAILIKLGTKGPVFYKQERYTIHKKRFDIYKFRTMVNDAEKDGVRLASADDPKITGIGKFLRAHRVDELPQLLNILKGEMSFVGPRPERPIYADEYSRTVKNYDLRYMFRAGLTGFAQVYGKYNTTVPNKILFDWMYIDKFSIWLDIKLLVQTMLVMCVKEASDGVHEDMKQETDRRDSAEKQTQETAVLQ